ncbi:MAG TPA: zinc-finger domain-containing protein [Geminicoccus sp.]|uniref:zinc-finger domain-containing protein n=1 Tax=Geminicoccus sp. TaxID=2024832 RepID=UPI002E341AD0|nr:zinc-finger domain-containing protein [Geminicoccus sp.]HEX2526336.1 zinc-finger domain-containing protein [Geminicoccus sp.]
MKDLFLSVEGREVVITEALYVRCDGGDGSMGHPLEFMTLEKGGETMCKYCGRHYIHASAPTADKFKQPLDPAA